MEDDCYGAVHPRDAMLPELVLLLCGRIREELEKGRLQKREDECIYLTDEEFADLLFSCRKQWKSGWSKEFREMEGGKAAADSDRIYEKLDDAEAGGASGDFAAGRWQTDRSLSG